MQDMVCFVSFIGGISVLMLTNTDTNNQAAHFVEFRRKVRSAELLSAATERLLFDIHFTGKLCVIVQNGRVLKSGYEEGYFRQPAI